MLYTDNLYQTVIKNLSPNAVNLAVISGYSAGKFLEQVAMDFPNLSIQLYLGMTHQGIPKNDHMIYTKLMKINKNIKVFYQVKGSPTHMKVYEFKSLRETRTLIGSANFSDNGFNNHREILTEVADDFTALFSEQQKLSLPCTAKNIDSYVSIIEDIKDLVKINYEEIVEALNVDEELAIKENEEEYIIPKRNKNILNRLKTNRNFKYYTSFEVEIVLSSTANPRWDETGINACFDNKVSALQETANKPFSKMFPIDKTFDLYTEDGFCYRAQLFDKFDSRLKILDGDFYLFIKDKIGLQEYIPISREMLVEYGSTSIKFERIDETKYIMKF